MNGNVRIKNRMLITTGCLCVVSALTSRAVAQCCDEQSADPTEASQSQQGERLGASIAIDGTVAVVGAPNFNGFNGQTIDDSGRVFIFTYSGSIWQQHTILDAGIDMAANDTFGFSVAIDGDIAVIGAPTNDDAGSNSGSAYIFENDGGDWSQVAKLTASDAEIGELFGWSVAINGDLVVIGAYFGDSDTVNGSGAVYVFDRNEPNPDDWGQVAKLDDSGPVFNDRFGFSVSIKGDLIAVGIPLDGGFDNIGAVNIFRLVSGTWTDEQLLTANDGAEDDAFGTSVSIDGDLVVVGAPFDDDQGLTTGSAYVFRFDSGTDDWSHEVKLTGCDTDQGDTFGASVAIDGNVVVVGAHEHGGFPQGDGRSYAFRYLSAGWAQVETLLADDADTSDFFGASVSLQNGNAVVGAPFWDESPGGAEGAFYGFTGLDSATSCNCPWDLNSDGIVSTSDLLAMFAAWGTCSDCNACPADLDDDCRVSTADLLILFSHWGQCVLPALPIEDVEDCFDRYYPDDTTALVACIMAISE